MSTAIFVNDARWTMPKISLRAMNVNAMIASSMLSRWRQEDRRERVVGRRRAAPPRTQRQARRLGSLRPCRRANVLEKSQRTRNRARIRTRYALVQWLRRAVGGARQCAGRARMDRVALAHGPWFRIDERRRDQASVPQRRI